MSGNVRPNPMGQTPEISKRAYLDPTAVIIGPVFIAEDCYIGPHAVIRADEADEHTGLAAKVIIGAGVNLQDGVILHALAGTEIIVEPHCSLAHGSVVHGPCHIETGSFVGFNSVVFKTNIGAGAMIKHAAVVEGVDIPAGRLVPTGAVITSGTQVDSLPEASEENREFMAEVVHTNIELAAGYNRL